MEAKPVVFLDGNSLAYRAFYALPKLQTSQGRPTGATLGFLNMLLRLLDAYHPQTVVGTFDHPQKTFRHKMYEEYKAKRKPMPDEMKPQLEDIKGLLSAMGFLVLEKAGFEADDLIGSGVTQLKGQYPLIIVSGDLDLLQFVDEGVTLLQPIKGVSQLKKIDREVFAQEWGIKPHQVIDFLALAGDPSDNIQGVPGIGEKTALKLVQRFGSWEDILLQRTSLSSHLAEVLWKYREQVEKNRELLRIKTDVPMETLKIAEWSWRSVRWVEFLGKLEDLELHNFHKRITEKAGFLPGTGDHSRQGVEGKRCPATTENSEKAGKQETFLFFDLDQKEGKWEENSLEREGVWYAPTLLFLIYPFLHLENPTLFKEPQCQLDYLWKSKNLLLTQPGLLFIYRLVERALLKAWLQERHKIRGFTLYPFLKNQDSWYGDLPLFGNSGDFFLSFNHPELQKFLEEESRRRENRSERSPFYVRTLYGWRFLALQPVEERELRRRFRWVLLDELLRLSIFILNREMSLDICLGNGVLRSRIEDRDALVVIKDFEHRVSSFLPVNWQIIFLKEKGSEYSVVLLSNAGGGRENGNCPGLF